MPGAPRRFTLSESLKKEPVTQRARSSALSIFSEEPVDLDTFIHDSKYLNKKVTLGPHQYDLIRHMEQIYLPETYGMLQEHLGDYWKPVRFVNRLHIQWGKGAGKDLSVTYAFARIAYLLLCLENPQEYFGLDEQSEIQILNVAMNSDQAKRAFFRPMGNLLKKSPWFRDKILNEITPEGRYIRLDKQIELVSGHSQVENFEGLSPIAVVLDEISGFESEESKANKGNSESMNTAEAVYDIVRSSAGTRFPENYKVAAISYPRFLHDPIQKLCAEAEESIAVNGDASTYYVDGPRATWDVNPRYDRFERIKVPETTDPIPNVPDLIEQYRKNASLARAKYECKPERASNRYMRNDSAIATAFPRKEDHWVEPLQIMYHWGVDTDGAKAEGSYELATHPGWQVSYNFSPELVPMEGAVYAIHADLAVNGDRAGIAMCHVKNWERRDHLKGDDPGRDNPDFQNDDRPVIKVDFVNYFEADMQATTDDGEMQPREIQLRWVRNLVRELRRRGFVIGLVTFDTYQSVDSIQMLEMWGIPADNLSVDRNIQPYATLREVMYDNRLEGYHHEILQVELEGLNLTNKGKVDHPPGGSKDMADALCGAVTDAITLGGDEGEEPEMVDVYQGLGQEVYTNWGGNDAFWGNSGFTLRESDLAFGDRI